MPPIVLCPKFQTNQLPEKKKKNHLKHYWNKKKPNWKWQTKTNKSTLPNSRRQIFCYQNGNLFLCVHLTKWWCPGERPNRITIISGKCDKRFYEIKNELIKILSRDLNKKIITRRHYKIVSNESEIKAWQNVENVKMSKKSKYFDWGTINRVLLKLTVMKTKK